MKLLLCKLLTSIFISSIFSLNVFSQADNNADFLIAYGEKRAKEIAFDYNVRIHQKSFASSDTLNNKAEVRLVRSELDSILGGSISMNFDSIWYGYDGNHIWVGDYNMSNLIQVDALRHPRAYILGTTLSDFVEIGFLNKSAGPIELYNDPSVAKLVMDSIIQGIPCKVFIFFPQDDGEFVNQRFEVGIDTDSYHVLYRLYSVWFQGNEQYKLWEFTNPRYHTDLHISQLDSAFLSQFKTVSNYETETEEVYKTEQFQFDKLTGKLLAKNDTITLGSVKADYIILDFWYSACYPCIKSIPSINQLANRYKNNDIRIYGINPIDNELQHQIRLNKFLANNPMQYPTIMIEKEIEPNLGLEGYPTFIILDKDLQVIYKEVGFSATLFEDVSAFLDARL